MCGELQYSYGDAFAIVVSFLSVVVRTSAKLSAVGKLYRVVVVIISSVHMWSLCFNRELLNWFNIAKSTTTCGGWMLCNVIQDNYLTTKLTSVNTRDSTRGTYLSDHVWPISTHEQPESVQSGDNYLLDNLGQPVHKGSNIFNLPCLNWSVSWRTWGLLMII